MATYTRRLRTVAGAETLVKVEFVVQTAFTLHTSNYWTITVRRRRTIQGTKQTTGELVGTYATDTRTLAANDPVTLYDEAQGLDLEDGDDLVAYLVSTGTVVTLDQPNVILDIQRQTR